MVRVLSGIQPSGQLHLGNYCGAVRQFLDLQASHELFIFLASYHALTTVQDAPTLRANMRQAAIDLLAFGLDPARCTLYLQHDVPEVTELAWLLSCVCPMGLMEKAVSFKDKTAKGIDASVGLFTYPILQAADILAVHSELVPVGKDQVQHIEITRDLANKFNHHYGTPETPVFTVPKYRLAADADVLPGIDGQKMSKSYGNTIDPFLDEKPLRKRIMSIVTDSQLMEASKDPEPDNIFQIYKALAGKEDARTLALAERYRAGGMGYGHAKQALFELVWEHFAESRARRAHYTSNPELVDKVLNEGAEKARAIASATVHRARRAMGLDAPLKKIPLV